MSKGDDARQPRAQSDVSPAAGDDQAGGPPVRFFYCGGCDYMRRGNPQRTLCKECSAAVREFAKVMNGFEFPCHGDDSAEFWVTYYERRQAHGLPLFTDLDHLRKLLDIVRGGFVPEPHYRRPGTWRDERRKKDAE